MNNGTDGSIDGLIKIRKQPTSLTVQLPRKLISEYSLTEVVFDSRELTIRQPTIFDNKTFKINGNIFGGAFPEELIGEYSIEKEGDLFFMTRMQQSKQGDGKE